jgi:hypothetical protein
MIQKQIYLMPAADSTELLRSMEACGIEDDSYITYNRYKAVRRQERFRGIYLSYSDTPAIKGGGSKAF